MQEAYWKLYVSYCAVGSGLGPPAVSSTALFFPEEVDLWCNPNPDVWKLVASRLLPARVSDVFVPPVQGNISS